jgi:hypothetical protein
MFYRHMGKVESGSCSVQYVVEAKIKKNKYQPKKAA